MLAYLTVVFVFEIVTLKLPSVFDELLNLTFHSSDDIVM